MKKINKNIFIILSILVIFGVTVGYAAINRTLNITGNSEIRENTWDIHFENLKLTSDSMSGSVIPTYNNNTLSINFDVMLNLPGDIYEFTVDVVNDGTIDAMIDSVSKTQELSDEQKKYMNYVIEYENGEQITSKQKLPTKEFVRIKVKVEYKPDILEEDIPATTNTFTLGLTLNYIQADNTAINVKDNGLWMIYSNGSLNEIGTIVTIGSERFYIIESNENNVKLFSAYNLHEGGIFNIYEGKLNLFNKAATGMQSKKTPGTTPFSEEYTKGTNYNTYSGSIIEKYANNYKTKLEEKFNIEIIETRPITVEELTSIGCNDIEHTCTNAPKWVYSSAYWTKTDTFFNERNEYVWVVTNKGGFGYSIYYQNESYGVRPLIIVNKNIIQERPKQIIEFTIEGKTYQAEEGMSWIEWVYSDFNTDNFFIDYDRISIEYTRDICLDDYTVTRSYDLIINDYKYIIATIPE